MNSYTFSKIATVSMVVAGIVSLAGAQQLDSKHRHPHGPKKPPVQKPPANRPVHQPIDFPVRKPGQQFNRPGSSEPGSSAAGRVTAPGVVTTTSSGRVYTNGITLRTAAPVRFSVLYNYFPSGVALYPNYLPVYNRTVAFISPYGYMFGVTAPYISQASVYLTSEPKQIVETPVMLDDACVGFADTQASNWNDRSDLAEVEPGLREAIDKIKETYQSADVDCMVPLISPKVPISVYLKGNYRYALPANDFVDLTQDTLASQKLLSLQLDAVRQQDESSFSVSGTQTYKDDSGATRQVFISFGLRQIEGAWILTQIGTAPDRVQPWN